MFWRWIRLLPNIAMAFLLVHHLVDIAEEGTKKMSAFLAQHPWYVFTSLVSVFLAVMHVFIHVVKTKRCCKVEPFKRRKIELLFYSVDGSWGFLWLMQVIVQWLLPEEHRAFSIGRTVAILALYGTQTLVDLLCVYYIFGEYRHPKHTSYKQVPMEDTPLELVSLRKIRQ